MTVIAEITDLKRLAQKRVPKLFFEYANSGSWSETTMNNNQSDFGRLQLRQKVAVDISDRNLASTMVSQPVALPFAMAPIGLVGMQSADGEIKAAKACEQAGIPFTLSTMSICSIEDVAANTSKPFWFQLYMMKDRGFIADLISRAKAAKCSALVVTLDLQIMAQRNQDLRNDLSTPPKLTLKHLWHMVNCPRWCMGMLGTKRHHFGNIVGHVKGVSNMSSLGTWTNQQFDTKLNWQDIEWVKKQWDGPLILKGIMEPSDANHAIEAGADAIVVSNHGGRQLDGVRSSIAALSDIVDQTQGKIEVHMDSGIRCGQDVLKALCLGAKGVNIGRPFLYGLGALGQAGVSKAIDVISKELDISMALCGERDIKNLGRHNIDKHSDLVKQYDIVL